DANATPAGAGTSTVEAGADRLPPQENMDDDSVDAAAVTPPPLGAISGLNGPSLDENATPTGAGISTTSGTGTDHLENVGGENSGGGGGLAANARNERCGMNQPGATESGDGAEQPTDDLTKAQPMGKEALAELMAELPSGDAWDWLREGFANMAVKNYSTEWISTLQVWAGIEQLGDGTGNKYHTTTNRTEWVSWWIKRRRTTNPPPIVDVPEYIKQWDDWWTEVTADQEGLFRLGKNGFINILMTLVWWRDVGKGNELLGWDAALAKVKAVMVKLHGDNLSQHSATCQACCARLRT
ncbi:hypothetical protein BD410DRAFT_810697, partial [Rickenella mellea]